MPSNEVTSQSCPTVSAAVAVTALVFAGGAQAGRWIVVGDASAVELVVPGAASVVAGVASVAAGASVVAASVSAVTVSDDAGALEGTEAADALDAEVGVVVDGEPASREDVLLHAAAASVTSATSATHLREVMPASVWLGLGATFIGDPGV